MSAEPFTFGIPLIARAMAADWNRVEALLSLTLLSLAGQSDRDFRVIVAGHDCPRIGAGVPFEFLRMDWPATAVRADNLDRGRKVQAINEVVLARGGGLLMFLDADDWVDTRLVARARASVGEGVLGAVIARGYAIDPMNARALPLPSDAVAFGFDRLCGSSVVARIDPSAADALHRDPYAVLHEHYRFAELCRERGAPCRSLEVDGAYLVATGINHSETHGPFAGWRRDVNEAVRSRGQNVDETLLARFGLPARAVDVLRASASVN